MSQESFIKALRRIHQRHNPDGSISTELSITVPDPRHQGFFMNIPSMYGGKEVSEEEALRNIINSGYKDPETGRSINSFFSLEEAVEAAKDRSNSLLRR